jgi:DNA-binding transcriptional regulator GbsR (MarR family)
MQDKMGLGGVNLRVYALIYSFTKAGKDCHASIEYIAERVDASYKSVQLALKYLVEKGYVTKTVKKPKRPSVYVAITDMPITDCRLNDTKLPMESEKTTDNNKDNNKEDNTNINIHSFIKEYYKDKPRPIQPFGSKKLVMMTLHEYTNLLRAAGVLPTLRYVRLLENRIIANRLPVSSDHYQMIIGWAREDNLITPEGEIILKN